MSRPGRLAAALTERVDRVSIPDAVVHPLRKAAAAVRGLPGGTTVSTGTPLGHPLHPLLVTAPIGAWTSAWVLDLTGSSPEAARRLVGAGVVMALPTAAAGLADWLDTDGAEQSVGALHAVGNAAATLTYAASWMLRRRHPGAGRAVGMAGALLATAAGWLGGHLVYTMGVGVDTNAFESGPQDWEEVTLDGPLRPDRAVRGEAGGVGLACAEVGGAPAVLADRCSHRGGPLSEGEVSEGCVTCPWHGSRFEMLTGAVRQGPASVPQPVYEARRRGTAIEARREERRTLRTNPV
ncbi:MAG TPA: DUF2231 domain-containing protein [Acidimicrobiales bacterium]|nr:DUF2231 domain-containing protein [Acidimicrobiales bacterium]